MAYREHTFNLTLPDLYLSRVRGDLVSEWVRIQDQIEDKMQTKNIFSGIF